MKVNRKVSGLARKLDYIGVKSKEDKRRIIKECLDPLFIGGNYLESFINKSYKNFKKYLDELSEKCPIPYPEIKYTVFQD